MSATSSEVEIKALQHRVEQAIRASRPRDQVESLLEEILALAGEESEASRFAHWHLAEIRLEASPWQAALHLRRVLAMTPNDDTAHAMMGLCHALQRNFRAAATSYRRALAIAPAQPWYNHNLGHLLDAALETPAEAITYLQRAHRAEPDEEEVGASYVHCLGRLGRCDEALRVTQRLLKRHPGHRDLISLKAWLEQGAPARPMKAFTAGSMPAPAVLAAVSGPRASKRSGTAGTSDEEVLAAALRRAGSTTREIRRGLRIWRDFFEKTRAKMCAVTAAAIDYALGRLDGASARQREVADRHGVSSHDLAARFREMKGSLKLIAGDARYQ